MTIQIRPAIEADAERVVAMSHALSAHEGLPQSELSVEAFLAAGFGASPLFSCHVAEVDGEIAGHICTTLGFEFHEGCASVWVADLFVDPEYRRMRVAHHLMAHAARQAHEIGAQFVQWTMVPENEEAKRFYRAIGAKTDQVTHLYLDHEALSALAQYTLDQGSITE